MATTSSITEKVNEELGGEQGHKRFCARLSELGLGQVLDIVPNHMAMGRWNRYWRDVLENGPSSRYATWFDIDWNSPEVKLKNKVLIPVLADQYGKALTAGAYPDRAGRRDVSLPLFRSFVPDRAASAGDRFLQMAAQHLREDTLSFIADSLARLPSPDANDPALVEERQRDKDVIFRLLARACAEKKEVCEAIARAIEAINGDIDLLDDLLNQQYYRLAYWRTADQELGYRRFFDVNTLIGLRMERQHVFDATHARVLEWVQSGVLDGIRVDHPDGLRDPQQYFDRLRSRARRCVDHRREDSGAGRDVFATSWPIDGTSGYDFLNVCNNLLVASRGTAGVQRDLSRVHGTRAEL